jgi:hypothetical protein
MQSIRTRYHGPTNTRPSAISAKCEAGSIRVSYDHSLNIADNHKAACAKMLRKLGWDAPPYGDMVGGEFDGDTYWVFDEGRLQALRGLVNLKRDGGLSGNPYCAPEFRQALKTIGKAYGYYGPEMDAPTRNDEISAWLHKSA